MDAASSSIYIEVRIGDKVSTPLSLPVWLLCDTPAVLPYVMPLLCCLTSCLCCAALRHASAVLPYVMPCLVSEG